MSSAPKSAPIALACLALLAATGCSTDGEDVASPGVSAAARQVAAVVERLERAARTGDFEEICDRLLTPAARLRAGGDDCEKSLREGAGDLRRARIRVISIAIDGERARARVRSRAKGQAPQDDQLQLERRRGRYRIAALAG